MSTPHKKVLLVDDEPRLLAALRRRLMRDFELLTAESGADALELLKSEPHVGIVVADMQMPGMTGVELLSKLREEYPEIRRIMLTGNADQETAMAAINEGAVMRFLRKPCDADELRVVLEEAFENLAFMASEGSGETVCPDLKSGEEARQSLLSVMNGGVAEPLGQLVSLGKVIEANTSPEDAVSNLRHIRDSGERMLTLVNRILDFAKVCKEARNAEDVYHCDVVPLLTEEVEAARPRAFEKRVTLSLEASRRHLFAAAREAELRIAIRELIDNAIKFSPNKGHVSVIVQPEAGAVRLLVADAGCGVPARVSECADDPFFDGDDGAVGLHEGLGLGLPMVSTIAKLNGGAFSIERRQVRGTSAVLRLRCPTADRGDKSASPEANV